MNFAIRQKNNKRTKNGFTLVETFVAIFILTFSIAGPVTIAQKGLSSSFFAKDRIIAAYLAQDVVEWIREARDTIALQGYDENPATAWLTKDQGAGATDIATNCVGTGKWCAIDTTKRFTVSGSALPCTGEAQCQFLKRDDANGGVYGYAVGAATQFRREANIVFQDSRNLSDEAVVTVKVHWKTGLFDRTYTLTETLLKWQ